MQLAMQRVQAWEKLEDPEYCGQLTMGGFRNLLIRAGFEPEDVDEEAKRHGWARLSAGLTM